MTWLEWLDSVSHFLPPLQNIISVMKFPYSLLLFMILKHHLLPWTGPPRAKTLSGWLLSATIYLYYICKQLVSTEQTSPARNSHIAYRPFFFAIFIAGLLQDYLPWICNGRHQYSLSGQLPVLQMPWITNNHCFSAYQIGQYTVHNLLSLYFYANMC